MLSRRYRQCIDEAERMFRNGTCIAVPDEAVDAGGVAAPLLLLDQQRCCMREVKIA